MKLYTSAFQVGVNEDFRVLTAAMGSQFDTLYGHGDKVLKGEYMVQTAVQRIIARKSYANSTHTVDNIGVVKQWDSDGEAWEYLMMYGDSIVLGRRFPCGKDLWIGMIHEKRP